MISVNGAFVAEKVVPEYFFSVNKINVFVTCGNRVVVSFLYNKSAFLARNGVTVIISF